MAVIEDRLAALGLVLPPAVKLPPGVALPFRFVRVVGARALISGHGPQAAEVAKPIFDCGLRIADRSNADCGLRIADL